MPLRGLALALTTLAACGITPRDGQFSCPDGACPAGFVCGSDQLCRAGTLDASSPLDASVDASVDAAATDARIDAAPTDAAVTPEACAPASDGTPLDEDMDGSFDEGCPFAYGAPHLVTRAMRTRSDLSAPAAQYGAVELSEDARSLFTAGADHDAFLISSRTDARAEFRDAQPAEGSALAGFVAVMVTVTGDATEVVLELRAAAGGGGHLYSSIADVGGRWSTPAPIDALTPGDGSVWQTQPHLRRDGLELYYVEAGPAGSGDLYATRRDDRAAAWQTPRRVGAPARSPVLSPDGRTLYFLDATRMLRMTSRASIEAEFSLAGAAIAPAIDSSLGVMVRPFFSPRTREVFFSLQAATSGAVPMDGPLAASVFRAEVCRDGPCVPAPPPCIGLPSVDGFHCYRMVGGSAAFDAAGARCMAGEHLVSIHSAREFDVVGAGWLNAWMGSRGRSWQSGEPFLYDEFSVQPTTDQCATTGSGWPLSDCTLTRLVICEADFWPSFTE